MYYIALLYAYIVYRKIFHLNFHNIPLNNLTRISLQQFHLITASRIRYEITRGNFGGAFAVKNMTGAIYVAGPLDYETRRRVRFFKTFNRKYLQNLGQIISPSKWSFCNKIIKSGREDRIFNSNNLSIEKCSMIKDLFWSIATQAERLDPLMASPTIRVYAKSSCS